MAKDEQWLLEEKYAGQKSSAYDADVQRLASGEPLAYVIGYQPFLGLKIYLDSKPLIPRPETEWWTEQLIKEISSHISRASASDDERHERFYSRKIRVPENVGADFKFLDLCAGSGAIGCAVLKNISNAQVYFGEIDPEHEATILKNIRENNLDESRAKVRIGDLFEPFADMKFDTIAANPPYIPQGRDLDKSVRDFEPAQALFAGEDGLGVIRRIAKELNKHLAQDGIAWIECDRMHATAACALFIDQGFKAEILTDQYNAPRVIVVSFT